MCLAIPMRVLAVDGLAVRCEARGVERLASLFLLQHETVVPGDMVMIHLGNVVQKVSAEDAREAWALYDQMLALAPEGAADAATTRRAT